MRVALDEQIFALQRHGGISRLFYEQAREFLVSKRFGVEVVPMDTTIVNEYVLSDPSVSSALQVREARGPYGALTRYLVRSGRKSNPEIFHTTFYLPRGLRDYRTSRRVVTVYDMIPELLPKTRRRLDFLTQKRKYIAQADHVVCISQSTRNDLFKFYPDLNVPTTIAYPGVAPHFKPGAEHPHLAPQHYILHVGKRGSYKDGVVLIDAFARVANRFPDVALMLVGGGPISRTEVSIIHEAGVTERVVQMDLPDIQMPGAYANAILTVLPSRYEGFGLPAVEALACGSPLILANTSSLPEVGGDAASYFPPGDTTALAQELVAVLGDSTSRSEMRRRGISRAMQFTWHAFAQANADAYRSTLE